MTATFYPGNRQFLAAARETTPGTAATTPQFWIPVESPKHSPKQDVLIDDALRGTMVLQHQQLLGMQHEELQYKSYLYTDSVFMHLMAALGYPDVESSATTALTTLAAAAAAGATTISTVATVPVGSTIQIDTGNVSEVVTTTAVSGAGPYTVTVPALKFAHSSGAAVATAAAPFVHKTSVYNGTASDASMQPPSYTLWIFEGDKCAQIAGARIMDLKFEFKANERPSIDVSWVGMPATYVAAVTNTPTQALPIPPSNVSIQYGGVAMPQGTDVTVEIKRSTKAIPALTGTIAPYAIYGGEVTVTGQLTSVFQGTSDPQYTNLSSGTGAALVISAFAQGDSSHPLQIQMSLVKLTVSDVQPSNTQWLTLQSTYNALGNTTDPLDGKESNIQASLTSASSTSY